MERVAFIFILRDQFGSMALHGLLDRFCWLKVFLLVIVIRRRFSVDDNYIVQKYKRFKSEGLLQWVELC